MFTLLTPRVRRLPLYLTGAGTQTPEGHITRTAGLDMHQVALVTSGRGKIEAGIHKTLADGDCFSLTKNHSHRYFPTTPPMNTLWLLFDGAASDGLMSLITDEIGCGVFTPSAPGVLAAKAYALLRQAEADREPELLSAMLYDFLMELLRQKETAASRQSHAQRLAPAIRYMEAHFARPLTLADIAATLDLSKYAFCKLFREAYQMTPFTYLTQLRLQNAKSFLAQNPHCSVKEAALTSGFRDLSYFGAVFRRYEHMTPKDFQQQYSRNTP